MSSIVRSSGDIVLFGRQRDLKLAILQAMATQRMIWNKDVGQIVGLPVEDVPRANHQDRKLQIYFKTREQPPWRVNGKNPKNVDYTIPDCRRGLTWAQIKQVALPFTWGRFRATAWMSNKRQMAVYGATKEEAERVVQRLASLSTAKITRMHVTEEVQVDPALIKQPTRYFPCYATLVFEPTDIQGQPRNGQKAYKKSRRRLDLYREPADKTPFD